MAVEALGCDVKWGGGQRSLFTAGWLAPLPWATHGLQRGHSESLMFLLKTIITSGHGILLCIPLLIFFNGGSGVTTPGEKFAVWNTLSPFFHMFVYPSKWKHLSLWEGRPEALNPGPSDHWASISTHMSVFSHLCHRLTHHCAPVYLPPLVCWIARSEALAVAATLVWTHII